jgi:hypothetical protein
VDWGVALADTESGQTSTTGEFTPDVKAGDNRVHFSATILY